MAISPTRAFVLGACSVLALAGAFVAGIGIGTNSSFDPRIEAATSPQLAAKRISCPSPPGFTATRAANERAQNCEDSAAVQAMLLATGATDAKVVVSREASTELLGPQSTTLVVAQVTLPDGLRDAWDAPQAARAIARAVGTTTSKVVLTDERLVTLFDESAPGPTSERARAIPVPVR